MKMPTGENKLADLDEFTVTSHDFSTLPEKDLGVWMWEQTRAPDYSYDYVRKVIILKHKKPSDVTVILPAADIRNGWSIEWQETD